MVVFGLNRKIDFCFYDSKGNIPAWFSKKSILKKDYFIFSQPLFIEKITWRFRRKERLSRNYLLQRVFIWKIYLLMVASNFSLVVMLIERDFGIIDKC